MDDSWKNGDKPTSYGAILGDALALIAAAGRKDMPDGMVIPDACLTCAFREGTLPNRWMALLAFPIQRWTWR